jgi:hypothetical protein
MLHKIRKRLADPLTGLNEVFCNFTSAPLLSLNNLISSMALIFFKYLPQATSHAEKMAIQYLDEEIVGLDEEHVAHWSSVHMSFDEVVLELGVFFKKHHLEEQREEVVAGVVKYAATYWIEEGGTIFPSSKVPKPKTNFKVSSIL